MPPQLTDYSHIRAYLEAGLSIFPIREKADGARAAKTPYGSAQKGNSWARFQKRIFPFEELMAEMYANETKGIALACGAVSGNLEVIDVDVKYKEGIDGILFAMIAKFYPDLWTRLLIHKTPSGGYHLLYRVDGTVTGNKKVAGYNHTNEAGKTKTEYFIETRGEGGYIVMPPSIGYAHYSGSLHTITQAERNSLIAICQSLTEIVTITKAPTISKKDNGYYSKNPFEDFNERCDEDVLLTQQGWKFFNENATYKYWTRPDRAEGGISASFRKDVRLFYIWTSTTDLDSQKWMQPATLVAHLLKLDGKGLYQRLTREGYGQISGDRETRIIERRAADTKPLPANLSPTALAQVQEARQTHKETYPHGNFWDFSDDGVTIERSRLYRVANGLGFHNYENRLVRVDGVYIEAQDNRNFMDALRGYIQEENGDQFDAIFSATDAWLEAHAKHTGANLPILPDGRIKESTKKTSYKFYLNCYVEITASGVKVCDYSQLDATHLIWKENVIKRNFTAGQSEGDYKTFLQNAIHGGYNTTLQQCIGYLSHEHKDTEHGYIMILTDECADPKDGGGTGKNIFSSMLSYATSWHGMDGYGLKMDEKMLQTWNGQRIISITDAPERFDFMALKSKSDMSTNVKKLYQNEYMVPIHKMPKILVSTNFSPKHMDGGMKRRCRFVEFTSYYKDMGGVNKAFGKMFADGFNSDDFAAYDNVIAECIQQYLINPDITINALTSTGWEKRFALEYGYYASFIGENMEHWVSCSDAGQTGRVNLTAFNHMHDEYVRQNLIKSALSPQKRNSAMDEFCKHNSYLCVNKNDGMGRSKVFSKIVDMNLIPF